MRGRYPAEVVVKLEHIEILQAVVRDGRTEQRIARRARILLRRAEGERVETVAAQVGQDTSTIFRVCQRYHDRGVEAIYDAARSGRPRVFSPLACARIENLACSDPQASGLQVTHWSARILEQIVVEQEIVTTIHYTSIALLLRQADLQPHRSRYWKTAVWNEAALERTAKILWCYERAEWLWNRGEIVVCLDEKPNLQILHRVQPKQLMTPGAIERHEFEYERQGTVNLLTGLTVATGQMWAEDLKRNDGAHFRPATERYLATLKQAKKVHVIMDNGPSHTSAETLAFFKALNPRTRVLFTPPHASWLNQGEVLLRAFSARYLQRGDWASQAQFLQQFPVCVQEYNARFAHPFQWSWTRRNFHDWLDWRELISCNT